MREVEVKAKEYADTFFYEGLDNYVEELVRKEDVRIAYKQGFIDATKWHYPSKGEYPTESGNYLIVYEVANALVRSIKFYNPIAKHFEITLPVIAWQYLPDLPPKEEA